MLILALFSGDVLKVDLLPRASFARALGAMACCSLLSGCAASAQPAMPNALDSPRRALPEIVVQTRDWLQADMPVIDNPVARLQLEEWLQRISEASDSHPSVRAAQAAADISVSTIEEAQALLRPQVSGGVFANIERSRRDGAKIGSDSSSELAIDPNIAISQIIYDGGAQQARIDAASSRAVSARNRLTSAEGGIALRAADTLIELARIQQHVELAETNLSEVRRIRNMISDRVQAGRDSPSDILQMNGRVAEAQRQVADLVAQRADVGARHLEIFGQRPVVLAFPSVFAPIPTNVLSALDVASSKNPDILSSKAEVKAAMLDERAVEGDSMPRIEVEGRVDYYDIARDRASSYDASVGLRVTYDLYDGGLRRAQEKSSQGEVRLAEAEAEQVTRDIELALSQAYANRAGLIPELKIAKGQLNQVVATRDAYQEQFIAGRKLLSDLISAQQEVFAVGLQVTELEADLHRQHFTIMSLLGELGSPSQRACVPTATFQCRGDRLAEDG